MPGNRMTTSKNKDTRVQTGQNLDANKTGEKDRDRKGTIARKFQFSFHLCRQPDKKKVRTNPPRPRPRPRPSSPSSCSPGSPTSLLLVSRSPSLCSPPRPHRLRVVRVQDGNAHAGAEEFPRHEKSKR
eukprot:622198-Hanusia_phi.AAC.1